MKIKQLYYKGLTAVALKYLKVKTKIKKKKELNAKKKIATQKATTEQLQYVFHCINANFNTIMNNESIQVAELKRLQELIVNLINSTELNKKRSKNNGKL